MLMTHVLSVMIPCTGTLRRFNVSKEGLQTARSMLLDKQTPAKHAQMSST